ncbi:MFS transporter [Jatrophihabitans sp. YIM 134969]
MTASLVEPVTSRSRAAVLRYTATATAARIGDAGAGIGVVLLAVDRDGARAGALVGGLLTASLTAPHVLGPWTGRLLDGGRDPRRVLGLACLVYAVALGAGLVVMTAGPVLAAAPALLLAGAAGPLLTGGLSSLVAGLGGDTGRARGVDALTYGVAGTAGPAAVAGLAAVTSPATSLGVVAVVVAAAAPGLLTLPRPATLTTRTGGSSSGIGLLFAGRSLRRVTVVTMAAAAAGGALAVVAVLLAVDLTGSGAAGPWLVVALGAGNLLGAVVVTARPWRGDPVRSGLRVAGVLGLATAVLAVVPTVAVAAAVFAVVGVLTAWWVATTLTARDVLAPPGRRGEVFVAMSGLKVAAGSGGTALAGVLAGWGARPLAFAAGALVLVALGAVSLRATARRPAPG